MTRPPWRPADIADSIQGRTTRPLIQASVMQDEAGDEVLLALPGIDEVYVIVHETDSGEVQPVLWPMKLQERSDN